MGYDEKLDEILAEEMVDMDAFGNSRFKIKFLVRLMRYDGGQVKMDIKRLEYGQKREGKFLKLGRLSLEEAEALLPAMERMQAKM